MATPENTPETDGLQQPLPDGEPLLDLTTLITRPTIRIDGTLFEILSPDEISIIDSHRFGLWGRRIQQLADQEGDEAEAELVALIDKVARRVAVGVTDAVYDQLAGAHKQAISDVFTGLLLRNRLGVAGAIAKAAGVATEMQAILPTGLPPALPTGAKQSRAWSDFMEERRNGGWLKRLLRWSGRS